MRLSYFILLCPPLAPAVVCSLLSTCGDHAGVGASLPIFRCTHMVSRESLG